jgi:hypothetical protein
MSASQFYLRTESIKPEDIRKLSVVNAEDRTIINALKSSEPCLLEGSRGTGKSFLMRVAELEIEAESPEELTVFVAFNKSSLINTDDDLQFYHWMLAKTLKALANKLRKKGLAISQQSAALLSNDTHVDTKAMEGELKRIVARFEESYKRNSPVEVDSLPDIEDVKEAIEGICSENQLERVNFFFDEAAHVFRPEQQRQFFNLFKDLRSPYVTCNAAIYPGVTHFGDSFEITHDCTYKRIERNIRDVDYLQYFKDIVFKQASDEMRQAFENQRDLFNTLAYCAGGNPRILLKTIQDLDRVNTASVNSVIKEFYRHKIWAEHTELGEKYKGHQRLIDWGREFLESTVVPTLEIYNNTRKERGIDESSIYFWVHKNVPESVKESLRLLTYTGILNRLESSVRATRSELGVRYEVKFGCILSLDPNPHMEAKSFFRSLSFKKHPEFGRHHASYADIIDFGIVGDDEVHYEASLRSMLEKPITVLELLTDWQLKKLQEAGIQTIEDLHSKSEDELIARIYNVGPVRARLMKNAANAELLEYLSG